MKFQYQSNWLKICRDDRGLTMVSVAKQIGMSEQHYCNLERGVAGIPMNQIKRIAKVLKTDVKNLLEQKLADQKDLWLAQLKGKNK